MEKRFYFAVSNCCYLPTYFILFLWLIGFPHVSISTKSSVSYQYLICFAICNTDVLSKTQVSYSKMFYCPKHKCHIPKWLTVQNTSVKVLPQICRIWQRFIRILKLSLDDVPGWSPIVKPRNDLKFDQLYLCHSINSFLKLS